MDHQQQGVFAAADRLVDAFARHDRDGYFAAFAPHATFIFHNLNRSLRSRAEYEAEWQLWESRDGFRVSGCNSSDRYVQIAGPVAIFTHRVETNLTFNDGSSKSVERETIVFEKQTTGDWLAIHEHLSPLP
ncbi:YybH family protein [Rhizobium leguminosarum]|uniref:YybH family protein n=1 Tax=Rhizobium leguminosarum TaxID=384 RepID=UPI001AE1C1FE|nr:nuclear transport factor 2 family protein [Rhizobium leguminosarum]MBP2446823.1 ketosteroid isomerase-like protein [Rhizobium leguminosarum]